MITLPPQYILDGERKWRSLYRTICKSASIVRPTKGDSYYNINDYTCELHPMLDRFAHFAKGHFNLYKAAALFEWYIKGDRNDESIEAFLPIYMQNKNINKPYYNSNYGYYIFTENQLLNAAEELRQNPYSRRAQIIINREEVLYGNCKDKLCTNYIQFSIVDNSLNMYVDMRSSDFYNLLPYDICMFSIIYELMHILLQGFDEFDKLKVGKFKLHIASFHVYEKDMDAMHSMYSSEYIRHNSEDFNTILRTNTNGNLTSILDFWDIIYNT